MATFKVLKDCKDKKDKTHFKKNEEVNKTVKYIENFEKRLEEAGYELPFFERIKE